MRSICNDNYTPVTVELQLNKITLMYMRTGSYLVTNPRLFSSSEFYLSGTETLRYFKS